mmetsp:Transcript_7120/g.11381  ORF Transcript_7120/g.11381 Transcript_7120/m.11381 type:complete len:328 (-) Transcript_7120:175-1158(-)
MVSHGFETSTPRSRSKVLSDFTIESVTADNNREARFSTVASAISQPSPSASSKPGTARKSIASRSSTMDFEIGRSRAHTTGDFIMQQRLVPPALRTPSSLGGAIGKHEFFSAPKTPHSARSTRPDSVQSTADSQWSSLCIDEAFSRTLQQAEDEGVDIFAQAPTPTYRQCAQEDKHPKLCAPHTPSSGRVLQESEVRRVDGCLTRDYFERPSWNTSTLPKKRNEDGRSLETIAREKRASKMQSYLRREDANRPATSQGLGRTRGLSYQRGDSKHFGGSPKVANQRLNSYTNRDGIPGIPFDLEDDTIRTSRLQQDGAHNLMLKTLRA